MSASVIITIPGSVGPAGAPGVGGENLQYNGITGEPIGGHRMVYVGADSLLYYADNTVQLSVDKLLGVSTHAAGLSAALVVQTAGEISEPSWNWDTSLPIYLSTNGLLTQTPPVTGAVVYVGFPTSSASLYLALGTPVITV